VENQWYFSVIDIIGALTDSASPPKYWDAMKRREKESSGVDLSTFCRKVRLSGADGKTYASDAVTTEAAFRVIQSIPSPKAEPFKRWLAQVGYERIQEIENPELAQQRMRELYKKKGYPDDWIDKRVRAIAIRDELTQEWRRRGIAGQKDYAILTAEISKATFGLTPSEYQDLKGLKRENLRDHMTDLELIFSMGGGDDRDSAEPRCAGFPPEPRRGPGGRSGGRDGTQGTGGQVGAPRGDGTQLPAGDEAAEDFAATAVRA
jgi:hypothetical protein